MEKKNTLARWAKMLRGVVPVVVAVAVLVPLAASGATTMGTAFTYRGQLSQSGSPYTGTCDFQFGLYDALTAGGQIGTTQAAANAAVASGTFAVSLDFGGSAFNGQSRWLETALRCPAGSGSYTTLSPRQELSPLPYALYAGGVDVANVNGLSAGSGLTFSGGQFAISSGAISNGMLANPSLSVVAGSGLSGGGSVALGGSTTLSIGSGSVDNAMLAHPGLTVNAGSGLTGGGTVDLGSTTSLSIGSGAVTGAMLAANAVATSNIANSAVTAAKVDSSGVQLRVTGTCPSGEYLRAIDADGSVTCDVVQLSGTISGTGFSVTGAPWPVAP